MRMRSLWRILTPNRRGRVTQIQIIAFFLLIPFLLFRNRFRTGNIRVHIIPRSMGSICRNLELVLLLKKLDTQNPSLRFLIAFSAVDSNVDFSLYETLWKSHVSVIPLKLAQVLLMLDKFSKLNAFTDPALRLHIEEETWSNSLPLPWPSRPSLDLGSFKFNKDVTNRYIILLTRNSVFYGDNDASREFRNCSLSNMYSLCAFFEESLYDVYHVGNNLFTGKLDKEALFGDFVEANQNSLSVSEKQRLQIERFQFADAIFACDSGGGDLARILRRPTFLHNLSSFNYSFFSGTESLVIWKTFIYRKSSKMLSLFDFERLGLLRITDGRKFHDLDIEVVENSQECLHLFAREALAYMRGEWEPDAGSLAAKQSIINLFKRNNIAVSSHFDIPNFFAKSHSDFFGI